MEILKLSNSFNIERKKDATLISCIFFFEKKRIKGVTFLISWSHLVKKAIVMD